MADEVELEEELEIESIETDQEEVIEIIEVEEEESDEILNFAVVENKPVFPGCEKEPSEEAKFQCFQLSLMKFISKKCGLPGNVPPDGRSGPGIRQLCRRKERKDLQCGGGPWSR